MKLIISNDIINLFDDITHFFDDITHFFKYDKIDITSDMIICTKCLKKNALTKNKIDESTLRRRASCNRSFQMM